MRYNIDELNDLGLDPNRTTAATESVLTAQHIETVNPEATEIRQRIEQSLKENGFNEVPNELLPEERLFIHKDTHTRLVLIPHIGMIPVASEYRVSISSDTETLRNRVKKIIIKVIPADSIIGEALSLDSQKTPEAILDAAGIKLIKIPKKDDTRLSTVYSTRLQPTEKEQLIGLLKRRFDQNPALHKGIEWQDVANTLKQVSPLLLMKLAEMEKANQEPQVMGISDAGVVEIRCKDKLILHYRAKGTFQPGDSLVIPTVSKTLIL